MSKQETLMNEARLFVDRHNVQVPNLDRSTFSKITAGWLFDWPKQAGTFIDYLQIIKKNPPPNLTRGGNKATAQKTARAIHGLATELSARQASNQEVRHLFGWIERLLHLPPGNTN